MIPNKRLNQYMRNATIMILVVSLSIFIIGCASLSPIQGKWTRVGTVPEALSSRHSLYSVASFAGFIPNSIVVDGQEIRFHTMEISDPNMREKIAEETITSDRVTFEIKELDVIYQKGTKRTIRFLDKDSITINVLPGTQVRFKRQK